MTAPLQWQWVYTAPVLPSLHSQACQSFFMEMMSVGPFRVQTPQLNPGQSKHAFPLSLHTCKCSHIQMELCQTPISHVHIYHKMNVNGVCGCTLGTLSSLWSDFSFYTTVIKAGEMSRCRRRSLRLVWITHSLSHSLARSLAPSLQLTDTLLPLPFCQPDTLPVSAAPPSKDIGAASRWSSLCKWVLLCIPSRRTFNSFNLIKLPFIFSVFPPLSAAAFCSKCSHNSLSLINHLPDFFILFRLLNVLKFESHIFFCAPWRSWSEAAFLKQQQPTKRVQCAWGEAVHPQHSDTQQGHLVCSTKPQTLTEFLKSCTFLFLCKKKKKKFCATMIFLPLLALKTF